MYRSLAAAGALAAIGMVSSPASAHTATTPVRITLTVAQACVIADPNRGPQTGAAGKPAVKLDAAGNPALTLESFLNGCSADGHPATLTVTRDSLNEGFYVATINF